MTVLEYAIARYFHVLEAEQKSRPLTEEEQEFLEHIRPHLKRLARYQPDE